MNGIRVNLDIFLRENAYYISHHQTGFISTCTSFSYFWLMEDLHVTNGEVTSHDSFSLLGLNQL